MGSLCCAAQFEYMYEYSIYECYQMAFQNACYLYSTYRLFCTLYVLWGAVQL